MNIVLVLSGTRNMTNIKLLKIIADYLDFIMNKLILMWCNINYTIRTHLGVTEYIAGRCLPSYIVFLILILLHQQLHLQSSVSQVLEVLVQCVQHGAQYSKDTVVKRRTHLIHHPVWLLNGHCDTKYAQQKMYAIQHLNKCITNNQCFTFIIIIIIIIPGGIVVTDCITGSGAN